MHAENFLLVCGPHNRFSLIFEALYSLHMSKIHKAACTSGVYIEIGERGFRVGQSKCMESRVKRSVKENAGCLGQILDVQYYPESSRTKRLALERDFIDLFGGTESCNRIRA